MDKYCADELERMKYIRKEFPNNLDAYNSLVENMLKFLLGKVSDLEEELYELRNE